MIEETDVAHEGGQTTDHSKRRKKETEEKKKAGKKNDTKKQFRSNMTSLISLLKEVKLEKHHKEELKKTPFWNFFQPFINGTVDGRAIRKCDTDVKKIIRTYNSDYKAFHIGNKYLKVRDSDISILFGIPSGQKTIDLGYESVPNTAFAKRNCSDGKRLTPPIIKSLLIKAVKGEHVVDHQDVARLLCLYVFVTLFFVTSGTSLGWAYLPYLEHFEKMGTYDWPELIKRQLLSSIEKSYSKPSSVTGCVLVLLVSRLV